MTTPTFRNVFFSFHYEDVDLASQIRNAGQFIGRRDMGFQDWADWEAVRRQSDDAIKRWINSQLSGSSVTVVLIGTETACRRWVNYEIQRSWEERKGMLGIDLSKMIGLKSRPQRLPGRNPFGNFPVPSQGLLQIPTTLAQYIPVYCWVTHGGHENLGYWVAKAAQQMGR